MPRWYVVFLPNVAKGSDRVEARKHELPVNRFTQEAVV